MTCDLNSEFQSEVKHFNDLQQLFPKVATTTTSHLLFVCFPRFPGPGCHELSVLVQPAAWHLPASGGTER